MTSYLVEEVCRVVDADGKESDLTNGHGTSNVVFEKQSAGNQKDE